MNRTREITEAGLFITLIAVLIIGAFYIPILGSIMGMFLPLPIIVLTIRNKPLFAVSASIVAIILSGFAITFISSIALGGVALIVGFPMGLAIKKKTKNLMTLLIGTLSAAFGFFLIFSMIELTTGIAILQTLEESFKMSMDIQTELTKTFEGLVVDSKTSLEEAQKFLNDTLYVMKLIMPALMLVFSMFYAAANLILSNQILKRLHIDHVPLGTFDQFKYPKHVAYGSMGMMILAYIIGSLGYVDSQLITANFAYLFTILFSIQGLSLIYYYIKKKSGKGLSIVVIILCIFLGLLQYIAFLGFFDVLMDLRKFDIKKSS